MALPQAVRAVRHGTQGVAPDTWVLIVAVTTGWAVWGLMTANLALTVTNALAAASAGSVVAILAGRGYRPRPWTIAVLLLAMATTLLTRSDVVPTWVAGLLISALPLAVSGPQLLLAARGAGPGVSAATWALSCLSKLCWIGSAIGNDAWLLAANGVGLVTDLTVLILVTRHRSAGVAEQAPTG